MTRVGHYPRSALTIGLVIKTMRFIWFRIQGSDPESGTENLSLNLESNFPGLRVLSLEKFRHVYKSFQINY